MKKMILSVVIILSFAFTGCNASENISSSNYNVIAEYMASMILKYDKLYEEKLVNPSDIIFAKDVTSNINNTDETQEDTNFTQTVVKNETIDVTNNETTNNSEKLNSSESSIGEEGEQYQPLSKVFDKKDFDIHYTWYKLFKSFPDSSNNEYFTLDAREDKQLLAIQFNIKNQTSKSKNINLIDSGITYQLNINSIAYNPLLTLLVNDLQFIESNINGGQSEMGYLVFEVDKNIKIDTVKLYVSKGSLKSSITLK